MIAPPSRDQLADRAARSIDAHDLRRALDCCEALNREHPDFAYGWYLAAFALRRAGRFAPALAAIERALELDAADKYRLEKAKCLFEGRDVAGARAALAPLREQAFDDARLHDAAGLLFNLLADHPAALFHFSRAVQLAPDSPEFRYNEAALLRYLGDAAGAEAGFDAVIALKPDEYEAYNARAQVRAQAADRNHVVQLRDVLARTTNPAGIVQLCFALAKELEDVGDHDAAFAALERGAATKRRRMRYDVATDVAILDGIRRVYGAAMFDGRIEGCDAPDPIFVIGMPRTGTTLVERILGSHSQVDPAGELNEFSFELIGQVRRLAGPPPASRLEFVDASARVDFRALGEAYLRVTRAHRGERPYFVDKLPFNFLYAGLIHLALPRARIVHVQRDPMDTCYAVYKQLFKDAYPFSYDLDDLARYYVAYHRLMQHWQAVLPGVIHTVSYEGLVADVEGQTRRLLEACGLDWEEGCLQFHRSTRASTTASALQVRRPVYDSSVGKWRHYARQLEPLRAHLAQAGIVTDTA